MYRKNCDRCGRPSFSSCSVGAWNCPICGHDLSRYPTFHAERFDRVQKSIQERNKKAHNYTFYPVLTGSKTPTSKLRNSLRSLGGR